MTGEAGGIGSLGIMTGRAAFNVPPCQLGMKSAARTDSDGCKTRLLMTQRPELELIDVSARHMTRRAEVLAVVAGGAFGTLSRCCNAMREPEIQIVYLPQRHPLRTIVCRQS